MSGPDRWQMQQELEQERQLRAYSLLSKAILARQDGYFTDEDITDMQRELGLSTRSIPLKLETF